MSSPTAPALDRPALVTGASRGIGAAVARALAATGHPVAVGYRSGADEADGVAKQIVADGGRALAVPLDVVDEESVDAAVTAVEAGLGPIMVLVNNAGVTDDGLFIRMDTERWRRVLATNLDGPFHVTRRVSPGMVRARWGRIVNVSSVVGLLGSAGQANYAAAKAGLVGFTRSLARELASRNITANVVAPGPIATEMFGALPTDRQADLASTVPLGRVGRPEEVAATVAFLCTDLAAYTTGAVVPVDGGLGMGH
ncbi:MAG TPA: 3-oxoacyl-[acyl-carrier-protein] reductase [Acidimicrobiales bacterium]